MKKALFVSSNNFINGVAGGGSLVSRRNFELLESLLGKDNTELAFVCDDSSDYTALKKGVHYVEGNIRGIRNVINELFNHTFITRKGEKDLLQIIDQNNYDLIWLDSTHYGSVVRKIKKKRKSLIISFAHDFEAEYMKMFCKPSLIRPHFYLKMYRVVQNEKDALYYSDCFISISQRDRLLFNEKYSKDVDYVMPVTINDSYNGELSTGEEEEYLLFVGSYFQPNVDGLLWFFKYVAENINYRIKIIGKGMEKLATEKCPKGVEIIGEVNDLSQYYIDAYAVIMPIFEGYGMKVKTAEAMMYGKRIIATDEALCGYNIKNVKEVYRCNDANEFIRTINALEHGLHRFVPDVRNSFLQNNDIRQYSEYLREFIYSQ